MVQELLAEGLPLLEPYLSSSVKIRESHERATPLIYLASKHKLTQEYIALHARLEERRPATRAEARSSGERTYAYW
jgi:chromosome partitioning protein